MAHSPRRQSTSAIPDYLKSRFSTPVTPKFSSFRDSQTASASKVHQYTDENRQNAEKKVVNWVGVQTRYRFTQKEEEIAEWIEQITRHAMNVEDPEQLANVLCDGKILCILMNALIPGSIPEIPPKKFGRVKAFLKQCLAIGVAKAELFDPLDLIYKKNMVQVIYCIHSLAEICHSRRIVPFFTGSRSSRKQQRDDWIRKARSSFRKGFEGWKVDSSDLLTQIKDQPANIPLVVEETQPTHISNNYNETTNNNNNNLLNIPNNNNNNNNIANPTPEEESDEELREYIIAKNNNTLDEDGFVAQKVTTDPNILFQNREAPTQYNARINAIFNTSESNLTTPQSTPSMASTQKSSPLSTDDEIYPAKTQVTEGYENDGSYIEDTEDTSDNVSYRPSTPKRRIGDQLRSSLQNGFSSGKDAVSSVFGSLTSSPYSPLSWRRRLVAGRNSMPATISTHPSILQTPPKQIVSPVKPRITSITSSLFSKDITLAKLSLFWILCLCLWIWCWIVSQTRFFS